MSSITSITNETKKTLRDYFNDKTKLNIKSIVGITKKLNTQTSKITYNVLRDLYNEDVNKIRNEKMKKYTEKKIQNENKKKYREVVNRNELIKEKVNRKLKSGFENDNSFTIDISNITIKDLINLIKTNRNKYARNKKALLKMGENQFYALNDATINKLSKLIENNYVAITETTKSDADVLVVLNNFDEITIEYVNDVSINKNRSGGFFNYSNNSFIDLSRYGIYTKSQFEKINWNKEDECLVKNINY